MVHGPGWRWVAGGLALLALILPAVAPTPLPAVDDVVRPASALVDESIPSLRDAAPDLPPGAPLSGLEALRAPATPTGGSGDGPSPHERLLGDLAGQSNPTAGSLVRALSDYYRGLGYGAPESHNGTFEANNTVSYTFNVGDANGDGHDDFALDMYCVSEGCTDGGFPGLTSQPLDWIQRFMGGGDCFAPPHRVLTVSGRDGKWLWQRALDRPPEPADFGADLPSSIPLPALPPLPPTPVPIPSVGGVSVPQAVDLNFPSSCAQEIVVGTAPLADGTQGLLTYRFVVVPPERSGQLFLLHHELYLLNTATGAKVWNFEADGTYYRYCECGFPTELPLPANQVMHAVNFSLLPMLQVPSDQGVPLLPKATQPALLVEGVGFTFVYQTTRQPLPGMVGTFPLVDHYLPNEWAAKLDMNTGAVEWNRPTFTPNLERSIFPDGRFAPAPFDPWRGWWSNFIRPYWYWFHQNCCYDSTGDGVPDLVYITKEWNPLPTTNAPGAYFVASNLVLIDGATGERKYQVLLEEGTRERLDCLVIGLLFCYQVYPQALGDTDGDGASDFIVHKVYYDHDYFHNFSVVSGVDGRTLWGHGGQRNLDLLVVGDADGDGGNDFVMADWFNAGFYFWNANGYSSSNVTITPLTLHNGRDGAARWRTSTFQAPIDITFGFALLRLNGLPDYNGDGVGDLAVDDPIFFPDLTVVHRQTFLSGRDATPIFRYPAVGTFAFPSRAPDLNGDGVDEMGLLSGDVNDLWITTYDGATGKADWSRRILATRTSSYMGALPRIRWHELHADGTPAQGLLINVQMRIVTFGGFFFTDSNLPQLAAFNGSNGTAAWALPAMDPELSSLVAGPTPLADAYADAYAGTPKAKTLSSLPVGARAAFGLGTFVVAALAGLGVTLRRRTP